MTMSIEKAVLIEKLTTHLTENTSDFIQACETFLGASVEISRRDPDLCLVDDYEFQEPSQEILYGEIFYG